jgi:hypothetical protein
MADNTDKGSSMPAGGAVVKRSFISLVVLVTVLSAACGGGDKKPAATVAAPPLTVTLWEVGLKLTPDLVGVTVYVPLATLVKL